MRFIVWFIFAAIAGGCGSEPKKVEAPTTHEPPSPPSVVKPEAWTLDGLAIGKPAALLANGPFAKPCDNDPTDENTRIHFYAGGRPCRDVQFPENTSVVVFTDPYEKGNERAGTIAAMAWLGGGYFESRGNFPLKLSDSNERVTQVLGPIEATVAIGGNRESLSAHKHRAGAWTITDGPKLVGFAIGAMPAGYTRGGSWNVVQQLYFKYTRAGGDD